MLTLFAILFASVLVHELGHSMAANSVDVRTKDIVLMPVGGVARLEGAPFVPKKELWISAAGPLVNLIIAGILWPFSNLQLGNLAELNELFDHALIDQIVLINLVLGLSNLLPAFPLDGGRIYRAILAMRLGHLSATQSAARLSRWTGLLLIVLAPFLGWSLVCFAFGIYLIFASTQELWFARLGAARQSASGTGTDWSDYVNPFSSRENRPEADSRVPDTVDAIDVKQI
jgi:stage IV sporulation protein FB